ncbi:MAG: PQQ-binding-like beta-propeller repeat protein [Planctomycetota bacterium]|nr:PQQ-binding-like beta-propeller repeat protein [Planctomycetota bacterium]
MATNPVQWLCGITVFFLHLQMAVADNWPEWRGNHGDGVCDENGLPTKWTSTDNVAWKVALPEPGNSTPVVWGDQIFVTQPEVAQNRRTLMCFHRSDGRLLWQEGTEWTEPDPTHATNPVCSSSPVTDGERVIAWFGSAGLICYDLDGHELWKRDLGIQKHIWGYGSSPVICEDLCYLNFGPGERSFLIAVNKKTGETVWQHDEPINTQGTSEAKFSGADYYGSWSTPVLRRIGDREQLIMTFPFRVCGLDPLTGKEIWTSSGTNALAYTSPLINDDIVVAMGGYNGMSLGIQVNGEGDITESSRMWRHPKTRQRIGSGAIHDGFVFVHNDPGIAECIELKTGKTAWEKRLSGKSDKGTNWSSVMIADGLCYTMTQGGDCFVFRASTEFELVATNSLGEASNSSVAASDGQLFLRTHQHLWCIGKR